MTANYLDQPFGQITAVIFDKDGTLLDFDLTWNRATADVLRHITSDDPERLAGAASDVLFDLESQTIGSGSPLVSESNEVIADLLLPWADPALGLDPAGLDQISSAAAVRHLSAMEGADDVVRSLHGRGIRLAVATNDSATAAKATVEAMGWSDYFDAAIGYDSGYGAKPAPGMVEGALAELGATADQSVMVGDSSHDIVAGNLAGIRTVQLIGRASSGALTSVPGTSGSGTSGSGAEPDATISSLSGLLDLF